MIFDEFDEKTAPSGAAMRFGLGEGGEDLENMVGGGGVRGRSALIKLDGRGRAFGVEIFLLMISGAALTIGIDPTDRHEVAWLIGRAKIAGLEGDETLAVGYGILSKAAEQSVDNEIVLIKDKLRDAVIAGVWRRKLVV